MRRLFDWIFYGHLWIAAAASALAWLSVRLVFADVYYPGEARLYAMIFAATFSVYTLHRLLSFRRAKGFPTAKRYRLVREQPTLSLALGLSAGLLALVLGWPWITGMLPSLLWAVPITVFYLTPPWAGWRRLRDLPYVKAIWVGIAWSIVTAEIPINVVLDFSDATHRPTEIIFCFGYPPDYPYGLPVIWLVRCCFTVALALLFDLRDTDLDTRQGVRTLAAERPVVHRLLVLLLLLTCAYLSYSPVAYLLVLPVIYLTYFRTDEDWYAVAVNGLLFVPPLVYGTYLL